MKNLTTKNKYNLLLPSEAAEILRISECTVMRYLAQGKLEGTQLPGKHWRIFSSSVEHLIHQGRGKVISNE